MVQKLQTKFVTRTLVYPKSRTNENRINENLASLDVDLSEVMSEISALEENYVSGWDPTAEP